MEAVEGKGQIKDVEGVKIHRKQVRDITAGGDTLAWFIKEIELFNDWCFQINFADMALLLRIDIDYSLGYKWYEIQFLFFKLYWAGDQRKKGFDRWPM